MADFNSPLYREITKGLSRALFVSAWADNEQNAGRSHSQENLDDIAPETPEYALQHAAYVIGGLEAGNSLPLASIYSQACAADGVSFEDVCKAGRDEFDDIDKSDKLMGHANEFGFCIGMMCLGTGVSWFDSHERFTLNRGYGAKTALVVPNTEFYIDPEPTVRKLMVPAQDPTIRHSR